MPVTVLMVTPLPVRADVLMALVTTPVEVANTKLSLVASTEPEATTLMDLMPSR